MTEADEDIREKLRREARRARAEQTNQGGARPRIYSNR